ncbi:MAG: hypothetical protein KDB82_14230 [Planctomycetes bacterium]|nr:hypothetical protein [Planctomycetota bacterium]
MTTDVLEYRDECLVSVRFSVEMRRFVQAELRQLRLGWRANWFNVGYAVKYTQWAALSLADCADWEVQVLNDALPEGVKKRKPPRKPRWARGKAPPRPERITWDDCEQFLAAVLEWKDTVRAAIEKPPGECYPHMPPSMRDVLRRNGFDPHNHRAPGRFIRHFFG